MTVTQPHMRIVLHQLEFFVFLGWGEEERAQQQRIVIDLKVDFTRPPIACATDNLADTFCYDLLNKTLQQFLAAKSFHLLEHLTKELYACIKQFLPMENTIALCVTKFPNAFFNSAGVSCWYSDNARDTLA